MRRIFDNNVVYVQQGYNFNMFVIDNNQELLYQLIIYKADDYSIDCQVNEKIYKEKSMVIEINKNSLFYQAFLAFLENESEIIIEDDLSLNGKQLTITKNDNCIQLVFQYEKEDSLDRFGINIINVFYDGRSKIDQQGKDTKDRLQILCDELFKTFKDYNFDYDGPVLKRIKKT